MSEQLNFNNDLRPSQTDKPSRIDWLRKQIKMWWHSVDRTSLWIIFTLIIIGAIMSFSASPSVAERIQIDVFAFAKKQVPLSVIGLLGIVVISMLSRDWARRLTLLGFVGVFILLLALPFVGVEIKNATRWIPLFGSFTIQPTEFLKPTLAVATAWFFSAWRLGEDIPGHWIATMLFFMCASLVIIQPDLGQTTLIASAFLLQVFILGISGWWISVIAVLSIGFFAIAYLAFPHVRDRIFKHWHASEDPTSQISRSYDALNNGGLLGTGLNDGIAKMKIPDAHTDFIFSVIVEEFGFVGGIALMFLFLWLAYRVLNHLRHERDLFIILAVSSLIWLLMAQAFINIASSIGAIPTKGMTLPFISAGLSSLIGTCFTAGLILSFTRKK